MMRFLMFDRITDFRKSKMICGTKQISQESGILEQVNGELIYPVPLALESLAQIGGWLVSASHDFSLGVVLGMMVKAEVFGSICIGDELFCRADVLSINDGNAVVGGEIRRSGVCVIRIEKIVYGTFKVDDQQFSDGQKKLFNVLYRK